MKPKSLYWLPVISLKLAKFANLAYLAYLVKIFKSVKVLKILLSFGTMLVSLFSYSLVLSPWFAVGFLLLLFIHEIGHVIALRQKGHPATLPFFIPFMGAVIFSPAYKERNTEAYVGIGGPILGTIGALFFYIAWLFYPENTLFLILSFYGCLINLFNLIPLSPFDGGRILQAVSDKMRYVGFFILVYLVYTIQEPGLLLIAVLSLDEFKYSLYQKVNLGVFIQIIMIALMLFGYGYQSVYLNILDVVIISILNLIRIYQLNCWLKLLFFLQFSLSEWDNLYKEFEKDNDVQLERARNDVQLERARNDVQLERARNDVQLERARLEKDIQLERARLEKDIDKYKQEIYGNSSIEKPILPSNQRLGWLFAYLSLVILLVATISHQSSKIDMEKIQQTIEKRV